ncbi:tetratricopeptide repeat protein [Tenacibaculum sp. Mcav3-52]|uniref:tetratricopeptide repeat protein n=1 Tax=Tenacibaculum sp. Mcav3-52 TaxID=2917762 RepID=UPI001EF1B1F4|nr:tetratricopeptide repeat protein [Tenacibaculum sp. Mcav3-52]MCG7502183.1 tetratricopeptide repeat protein [Tenacibaculum sp. Mcav3-52]
MKFNILTLSLLLLLINCTSKTNSSEFIEKAAGRYYFNADEIIEVTFNNDNKLLIKWRNQNLEPLKVNDSSFYVRELNEKLIFNTSKNMIGLAEKREHEGKKYVFKKLKKGEKTPSEHLAEGNFEAALKGYKAIKEKDSLNPVIRERNINRLGYQYLRKDEFENALNVFKINIELYPNSSNTYDSTADAYTRMKDTAKAIEYYKKALTINPENRSSKRALEKLTLKKEE